MKRESVGWGIILILVGLGFLANQLFPGLFALSLIHISEPTRPY